MVNADELETGMLKLINDERAAAGLNPLMLEQNLNAAAEDHSEWMLEQDVFSHTGVNGSSPTARITDANFDLSGNWSTAENIAIQSERGAEGFEDDVQDLHNSLMNSPGHRANLLDPNLKYIGIGVEGGDFDFGTGEFSSVVVTQNFATTDGKVVLDDGSTPTPAPEPTPEPTPTDPDTVVGAPDTPEPTPPVVPVVVTPDAPEPTPVEPTPTTDPAVPVEPMDPNPDCFYFAWDEGDQWANELSQGLDNIWTEVQTFANTENLRGLVESFDFGNWWMFDDTTTVEFQNDFMTA